MGFRHGGLAPTNWAFRDPGFVEIGLRDDGGRRAIPAMVFKPVADRRSSAWETARSVWLDLRPHPNLLDALEVSGRTAVVLRYAALHWGWKRVIAGENLQRVAAWGAQLADAFLVATQDLPDFRLGWLTNPFLKVDLGQQVRVGFLAASPEIFASTMFMPPELQSSWPTGTQRSLVYVAGAALRQLWDMYPAEDWPVARVVNRATDPDPMERFATLGELRDAFLACGTATEIRRGRPLAAWSAAEAGVGMLQLLRPAFRYFEKANEIDRGCELARWGFYESGRFPATAPIRPFAAWDDVAPAASALEAKREFRAALDHYYTVKPGSAPGGALFVALARCHLELGDTGHAIDYARRALAIEPRRPDAIRIEWRALIARSNHPEVLSRVVVADLDDVEALYLRAKALLAVRRLAEARDAFDVVTARRPKMLEAMLLRRETDRMLLAVRATVGAHDAVPAADDRLAPIRSMVIEGRTAEAIEELSMPAYADDPVARLLLADSLLTAQRADEALAVYVRVAQLGDPHREAAVVGTAYALLGLGRSEEALEMFEQACTSWPGNLDALEGQAQALDAQGRTDEAEALHRRATAARVARSDLRLRTQSM